MALTNDPDLAPRTGFVDPGAGAHGGQGLGVASSAGDDAGLPDSDPGDWDPDASEELTFQFSEKVEACEQALAQRLEQAAPGIQEDVRIESVHRIIQLMEGRPTYLLLRQRAAEFARAYASGDERSLGLLDMRSFNATQRYAVNRMILDHLEHSSRPEDAERFVRDQRSTLGGSVASSGDLDESWGHALSITAGAPAGQTARDQVFQTLALQPTLRSLFDAVVNASGPEPSRRALADMQQQWSAGPANNLTELGLFLMVGRLLSGVSSVASSAASFLKRAPGASPDASSNPGVVFKCARGMLDLAESSVPVTAMDKIVSWVCPSTAPAARRLAAGRLLLSLIVLWPDIVWATADSRALALQQLARKLGANERRQAPRGRTLTHEKLLAGWRRRRDPGDADRGDDE